MNIVATGLPATIEDYQVALNAAFAGGEAFGKAQQRTWVGLTADDRWEIICETTQDARITVMELVEAKLKEKNGIAPQANLVAPNLCNGLCGTGDFNPDSRCICIHKVAPQAKPEVTKYCSVCKGAGQVDTGIMESPVTVCNTCNGTGAAPQGSDK